MFAFYQICFNIILDFKLVRNNEDFIKCLLVDANYYTLYEKKTNNFLNKTFKMIFNIDDPVFLLESSFKRKTFSTPKMTLMSNKEEKAAEVFIYNTHQSEAYAGKGLKEYNINPGVLMASYLFKAKLAEENVETIILEDDLTEYMNLNNMNHAASYKASRVFAERIIKENKNLKLIIDLHRDSISKEKSTTIIDSKKYAKIIFVVGVEHSNYETNLQNTNSLNNMIKAKYPELTRGVLEKGGKNVNGIYNQDLSDKSILLEIGSSENTIDEVLNTITIISPIIKEYIHEK
jgi:stage II sporulation protein P